MLRLSRGGVPLALSCAGVALFVACGFEPDCPPGTAFDDCKASSVPNVVFATGGTSSAVAASGSGGSASVGSGGSGGSANTSGDSGSGGLAIAGMGGGAGIAGGSMDTTDTCPNDPNKMAPGQCGCGAVDTDFDGDSVADCKDLCPDNADRSAPTGPCGCSTFPNTAACTELRNAIRNLYTFDGATTAIVDSESGANGVILDATNTAQPAALAAMQSGGRLNLDGLGGYVDLPDGLISNLTNATFEMWVAWNSGGAWARLFDFGNAQGANGVSYLFLTPLNSLTGNLRVAYSVAGPGAAETLVDAPEPLEQGGTTVQHVAVVVDDTANQMRLYVDGVQTGTTALTGQLSAINDVNNWIGRSNFNVDPPLFGTVLEFRIYDAALTGTQLSNSFQAGPGTLSDPDPE